MLTSKNDMIIGCYTDYNWDRIKFWANSIDASGFTGSKVMIVFNSDKDTVKALLDRNFMVIGFKQDETRFFTDPSPFMVHVERFFHIWHTLQNVVEKPRYVITTDVRDVVFQTNPSEWLEDNLGSHNPGCDMVASSESIRFIDEPWNNHNLYDTFGGYFHEVLKNREVYNVGVLAGKWDTIKDLSMMIFQMSLNRPIPITDQSVYNFLLAQKQFSEKTFFPQSQYAWAAQLGTTMDPTKIAEFRSKLLDEEPIVKEDGVYNSNGRKYCIVHQYDRVPGLREQIEQRYA